MEDYIKEALQQQLIRPSTSPAASASSSWARRTEACGPASTTGPSMIALSSSLILFPWSCPPSRNSVGPASSRRLTCGAPITSFVSGKATSGRQRSLSPQATMNIGLCRMAFPTPRPSSRGLWTRCSGSPYFTGLHSIYHVPYATLSFFILLFFTCPYLYSCNSCILCMYVYIIYI